MLQCVCCSVLQCDSVSVLQHLAVSKEISSSLSATVRVLQRVDMSCVAVCCSELQCTAVCCSVLQ